MSYKKNKYVRMSFVLPPDYHKKLKIFCEDHCISIAKYVQQKIMFNIDFFEDFEGTVFQKMETSKNVIGV